MDENAAVVVATFAVVVVLRFHFASAAGKAVGKATPPPPAKGKGKKEAEAGAIQADRKQSFVLPRPFQSHVLDRYGSAASAGVDVSRTGSSGLSCQLAVRFPLRNSPRKPILQQ